MLEYHISKPVISELLSSEGLMNVLTVIPVTEIESKGIPYIRRTFNENGNELKFNKFWKYFTNTWMVRYSPTDWNINGIIMNEENERKMINRTNNPVGGCWLLVVVGCCWLLFVVVGCCWLLLVVVGSCWLLLVVVVVVGCCFWLLLVVVGCCWLLMFVVDVRFCWLLLVVVGCC
jgi:hypothetical protein